MNRQQGTVKWFSRDKGWGFVRLEDGSEIFVHHSDIEGVGHKTLQDDERVEFSVEEMEKGPRAREVRRLDGGGKAARTGRTRKNGDRRGGGGGAMPRPEEQAKPVPLAQQLRKRLSGLFPGIGG